MSDIQVLLVGSNPNLSFYGWRLHETRSCQVTIVNPHSDSASITFQNSAFGKARFTPFAVHNEISQVQYAKYDIVIVSCNSLQDFQTLASQLQPYLSDNSLILLESTGYINLEPFMRLNLADSFPDVVVCSIMNETDVRQIRPGVYHHCIRNNDNRIYLGSSIAYDSNLNAHPNFNKAYKLLQLVQEDSGNKIALLKAVVPKEFMTYQWKLALSRIIFNPILIIFELEYPVYLKDQILCKPLVTGILSELLKVIKKMECKLVRGFENETNLFNYWSELYRPSPNGNEGFIDSPRLFHDYYHMLDLEIDLLLLQPILLGDDHGVRTPYLENLYSMMCQMIKINDPNVDSIFFRRKLLDEGSSPNGNHKINGEMAKHQAEYGAKAKALEEEYNSKMNSLNILTKDMSNLEIKYSTLGSSIKEREIRKNQLFKEIELKQASLMDIERQLEQQKEKFDNDSIAYNSLAEQMEALKIAYEKENSLRTKKMSTPKVPPPQDAPQTFRSSIMGGNLDELTDIAIYGAQLNGEMVVNPETEALTRTLQEKESALKKREQELLNRERKLGRLENKSQQLQQSTMKSSQTIPVLHPKDHEASMDQNPPHGLPSNGLPQNSLAQNLNMGSNPRYQNYTYDSSVGTDMNGAVANGMASNGYGQGPSGYYPGNGGMPMGYNQYGRTGGRLNSLQSQSYYDPQMNYQNQAYQQQPQPQPQPQYGYGNFQGQAGPNFYKNNGYSQMPQQGQIPMQSRTRNPNRRSAFPMNDDLNGLDMGGRGGMPMPSGPSKTQRHRSSSGIPVVVQTTTNGQYAGPGQPQPQPSTNGQNHQKSMSTSNLLTSQAQHQSQHLKVPPSSKANEDMARSEGRDVQLAVAPSDASHQLDAKPLGGISSLSITKEKKKKGIFRKH